MSEVEPCHTCGGRVRIEKYSEPSLAGGASDAPIDRRVCLNPDCPLKTGEASAADRV